MTYPTEIQELLDAGKLEKGYCCSKERYAQPIDYSLLWPTRGTQVATSEGHGVFKKNPGGKTGYHLVDFFYNHKPFSERWNRNWGIANRVSVLLYDDQVELMKQMADDFRDLRSTPSSKCLSRGTYEAIGKRSFMTLESIMAASGAGMYDDKETFRNLKAYEPLANPDNKEVIWKNLPGLWGEDRSFLLGKTNQSDPCGTKASFDAIITELEVNPEEFLDALQFLEDCQLAKGSVIGGCYICERDCH